MDVESFLARLEGMDEADLRAAAHELGEQTSSAAGEVSWWQATVAIDRQMRATRAGRVGAAAAKRAADAVLRAATAHGVDLPDADVTVVARAAADVARGLAVHAPATDVLLQGWHHLAAA